MLLNYIAYSDPNASLRKGNRGLYDKVVRIKEKLGVLGAEELVGISFPYTAAEYNAAMEAAFPVSERAHMSEDEFARYYAVQDLLRDDGTPGSDVLAHTAYDEEWLRDRYGDDYYEKHYEAALDEDSWLPMIRSLGRRRHMSMSPYGNIYDTGIKGTLLSVKDKDVEDFLDALAEHGPFAFILEEPGIYNVACLDSPYHMFNGIWDNPSTPNEYIRELRGADNDGMQVEYMIANTISIMEKFGLNFDEISEFLMDNPEDYEDGVDWYMVNNYRGRAVQYWPFK